MKNLKKVLALVLAFACAFTMFAGAASFTDQADIKATDAVAKLVALGVINGNPDGSFKPEGTVTRAEMAKMIYVVRNGGNDNADSYKSIATKFTDVNGHWAAGFIKYCEAQKIIAGKSATIFDPDGLVTGTEAAKMLLVTAGYQADKAGLTGTGWDQKTLALASEAGLLDDMGATNLAAGLPRQYAAQIISNALDSDTVVWSADTSSFEKKETNVLELRETGNGNSQWVSVLKNETVGQKYMKLSTVSAGVLQEINKEDGKTTYTVKIGGNEYKKVEGEYSALMGQSVKVMIKDNDTSKVYGIYADDDSKVLATTTVSKLDTVSGKTDRIKVDGSEVKVDGVTTTAYDSAENAKNDNYVEMYHFNNADFIAKDATEANGYDTIARLAADKDGKFASYAVKLLDNNGNGKIDTVVVTPNTVKEVTFVGKTSVTAGTSYKFDDCDIYEGIAKNDWAIIVKGDYTVSGDDTLTKAETMSGKVTGTKTGSAKIDGTWYDLNTGIRVETNSTYDFVIVGGVIYNAKETSDGGQKSIVYISALDGTAVDGDFDTEDGYVKAKAYFVDGTSKTIKITKFDNKKLVQGAAFGDLKASSLYTYGVNSSDEYELKQFSSTNKAGYDDYKMTGAGWASEKIDGTAIASDAVVFVQNTKSGSAEVKVLSGKTVKDWSATNGADYTSSQKLTKTTNGINYVQVGVLTSATATSVPGASSDYKYGYLTSDAFKSTLDGDTAVEMTIWNGTSEETVYVDTSDADASWVTGAVVQYAVDGKYVDIKAVKGVNRTVSESEVLGKDDLVAITGFDYKAKGEMNAVTSAGAATTITTLDEDCIFIGVDTDKEKGVEADMNAVPLADEVANGAKVTANAILFTSSNKIVAVIFDTNNAWNIGDVSYDFAKPVA